MMEVLPFIELLELVVESLCLSSITLTREVAHVVVSNVVFELLQHSELRQSALEPLCLRSDELRQVVCNLLVGVEA